MRKCTTHSSKQISTICYSFECNYYRQLCQQCQQIDNIHKQKHIHINNAIKFVKNKLQQCQKSIDITKIKKQQSSQKHLTLPIEIQDKLSLIRSTIHQKIAQFQTKLKQQYTKQVNTKLDNLQQTLKKSKQFFEKQLKQIQNNQSQNYLKKFFLNFDYWNHQLRYYNDYIDQILKKQVTKFKQSFDDDNLMKLNVNFQKNLNQVFISNKQRLSNYNLLKNQKKLHLFYGQNQKFTKFTLKQQYQQLKIKIDNIKKEQLNQLANQNYQWKGTPQSIYYPQSDSYYICGQGQRQSNIIVRYTEGHKDNKGSFTLFPSKMLTKRSDFAICLLFDQIYIIGGYNDNQGCLSSCQKILLYKDNKKNYQISSLQQRSSCHSVCNFNNKYILKFGGFCIKPRHNTQKNQIKQLFPEIYSLQKEQWKTIKYINNQNQRLMFGIWPLIMGPFRDSNSKIIIFGNRPLQYLNDSTISNRILQYKNVNERKKFQIKCNFDSTDLQIKIIQKTYPINKKYFIYPNIYVMNQNNKKAKVFVRDTNSHKFNIQKIKDIQ